MRKTIDKILGAVYARRSEKALGGLGSAIGVAVADVLNNIGRDHEDLVQLLTQIATTPVGQEVIRRLVPLASEAPDVDAELRKSAARLNFYEAWMAHKAAGFDASHKEAERIAALYGVEAPPFEPLSPGGTK